jgi:Domain of unknown function (DUF4388)
MALTGEVSDLSLGELIEFFCNQRKTGRLKLVYPAGPAYFYLQSGSVVHARIGDLRGIEAVYYALTLPNASFTFSPAVEAPEHSINQPWTSVVLEGLRRMDEGIKPRSPAPESQNPSEESKPDQLGENEERVQSKAEAPPAAVSAAQVVSVTANGSGKKPKNVDALFAHTVNASQQRARPWKLGLIAAAVLLIITAVGVPWGWYVRSKAKAASQPASVPSQTVTPDSSPASNLETATSEVTPSLPEAPKTTESADPAVARRQREARLREQARYQQGAASQSPNASQAANPAAEKSRPAATAGAKKVTVQVTYDENGRVTQASGGDATALRIARQKRFPAGKAGSATIIIPIN